MARETTAAARDERAPLRSKIGLAAFLGQIHEKAGLCGDLLSHAELVEESEATFGVPVCSVGIAGRSGEQPVDPFHTAPHEAVAALDGVYTARCRP